MKFTIESIQNQNNLRMKVNNTKGFINNMITLSECLHEELISLFVSVTNDDSIEQKVKEDLFEQISILDDTMLDIQLEIEDVNHTYNNFDEDNIIE